jgi:hypothetical protein
MSNKLKKIIAYIKAQGYAVQRKDGLIFIRMR